MPDTLPLAKAQLIEIQLATENQPAKETGAVVKVQFNPETLKLGYSNTMTGGDQAGGAARQFVTKSTTKLSVELWFDASALADVDDVRALTKEVNHFVTPKPLKDGGLAPPPVRFLWGSFLFEGVMDSMDETLELFSWDGKPLRAKVSIAISSQEIQFQSKAKRGAASAPPPPGTTPRAQAQPGDSLQQMMGRRGSTDNWQAVAAANGIENPRRLQPGAFLDLSGTLQ